MTDRSSKPHRSHKRQKSSLTNIGYYYPEQPTQSQPQFRHQEHDQGQDQRRQEHQPQYYNRHIPQGVQLSHQPSHQHLLSSIGSQPQPYYDYDPYYSLGYSFASSTAPSSSTGINNSFQGIPVKPIVSPNKNPTGPMPTYYPYQLPQQYHISGTMEPTFGPISQSSQQFEPEAPTMYEQFTYPKPTKGFDEFLRQEITPRKKEKQSISHSKNLSVSSRFNLFNLNEGDNEFENETERNPGGTDPLFNEFLENIINVDGSNINSYLLNILEKLGSPLPLDDFYNFLYNNEKRTSSTPISLSPKIDKTINKSSQISAFKALNELLNIFKAPNLLIQYFPNMATRENKLFGINYHELLRTFLAIKILHDVLIQLPTNNDPQNHTIPRLSIYKTYYIICQKLIRQYPSPTNTSNEQQKLILGQSKLGKLLKLVYPDLLIKRLGSRGDSKYNYLGVVWNENIINDEVKRLCDVNELVHLHQIFDKKDKSTSFQRRRNHSTTSYSSVPGYNIKLKARSKSEPEIKLEPVYNESVNKVEITTPSFSFIKTHLKFPEADNFTILEMKNQSNWFKDAKCRAYDFFKDFEVSFSIFESIKEVFLSNDSLLEKNSLCDGFINRIVKPINNEIAYVKNLDLYLYLIIILELLPFLLFLKTSNQVNYLKNLRLNLLFLIDNMNIELSNLRGTTNFSIENSKRFIILMKKLININDLLITFIKLINQDDPSNSSIMAQDIENYLHISRENETNYGFEDETETRSSFRRDILTKDLIHAMNAYNFDPSLDIESNSILSQDFINGEVDLLGAFFKTDLFNFLNNMNMGEKYDQVSTESSDETDSILSKAESIKLVSLFALIHDRLLTFHFKSKYPILVYTNILSLILNDALKYIFIKYQRLQNNQLRNENQNSFGNWWVFNSFVQEYLSLIGEVVGLDSSI